MSTKVYDVFKTNLSEIEILEKLIDNREKYLSVVYSHFINQMLTEAVVVYDLSKLRTLPESSPYFGLTDFESFLRKSYDVLLDNERQKVFSPNARLIIGIRPMIYNNSKFVLVAPYGSHDLVNYFIKDNREYLIDFEYYNNTDRPDDVSKKEWGKREKIWDIVFDKYWSRIETMFQYEINDKCSDLPHIGHLFRGCDKTHIKIPSDEKRLKQHLRDWYIGEKMKEVGKDDVFNNTYTYLTEFVEKNEKGEFADQISKLTLHPLDGQLINYLKNGN